MVRVGGEGSERGRVPVVVLTARTTVEDRVHGLRLGADDYVTRPFSPTEVVLRVGAVLQRVEGTATGAAPVVSYGDGRLRIDGVRHEAVLDGCRIVDDLGRLAEAESARLSLHLAEVDLTALAEAAVAEREAELRTAGLTVHTVPGPASLPVRVDADRLHQALGNLLSNTARHCRPGDTVTVTTSATPTEALVEVADTGPGIPADELPHVFDRLWRGARARAGGGSGIGLAVGKELVTAHGGTVTAVCGPGGGTRMTLRLPRPASQGSRLDPGCVTEPRVASRANTPRGI